MIDEATLGSVASRYGIPPTILQAALKQGVGVPDHIAFGLNLTQGELKGDENLQAEVAARALAQSFRANGTWSRALAGYFSGDPDAPPDSQGAAMAAATIGTAAVTPGYGMEQYGVGGLDASLVQNSFADLAKSWEPYAQQGGIISAGSVQAFQQRGEQLVQQWYQQRHGGVAPGNQAPGPGGSGLAGPGGQYSRGDVPGGLVTSKVFGQSYGVTQGFGTNGEQGADFATPEGTPVFAGFGGTVHIQNYGAGYTGLSVWVDNGKGWQFFAGHMLSTDLHDGQQINPGDVMGTTGGGARAAALGEQGHSSGPHSEIQIRQVLPNGQYIYHDPATVVANAGKTSGPIGGASFAGSPSFLNPADAPPPEVVSAAQQAVHTNNAIQRRLVQQNDQAPAKPQISHTDVAKFAAQARAAGIVDPSIFMKSVPYLSRLMKSLTGKAPTLDHVAQIQGMGHDMVRQWAMNQPHPVYPHATIGDMKKTQDAASLYSATLQGRMPHPSEVARLVALNGSPGELKNYYSQQTHQMTPDEFQKQQQAQQQMEMQAKYKPNRQGGPQ